MVHWTISGTFPDGGTISGWFDFDADIAANNETSPAAVTAFDITTTTGSNWPAYQFNPFGTAQYTSTDTNFSFVPSACCGPGGESDYLFTFNFSSWRTLGFAFSPGLSDSGGTFPMVAGYEYSNPLQTPDVTFQIRGILDGCASTVAGVCTSGSRGGAGGGGGGGGGNPGVPEPGTLVLLVAGLALAARRRRPMS